MDNLTHSLFGLAAAKAGLERRTPYATFVCVAAANLPDVDIVARINGAAFYLEHHRGITHSIVGTLALAFVFPLLIYAGERLWARMRGVEPRARLKGLLVCSVLLTASHPLLDWTNSYGVRPWLPWDGGWIYGDLLFVVDPWVWLVLGGASFLLAESNWRVAVWVVLALAATALFVSVATRPDSGVPVGALLFWCAGLAALGFMRRRDFGERFGRGVAASALAFLLFYCTVLWVVQTRARGEATYAARQLATEEEGRGLRVAATPVLADPFTWRCLAENEQLTVRFDMRLGQGRPEELRNLVFYQRHAGEEAEAVRRAAEDPDARVLLDFARFPVARVRRLEPGGWVVQFADLRFTEPRARARPGGFALDVTVDSRQ